MLIKSTTAVLLFLIKKITAIPQQFMVALAETSPSAFIRKWLPLFSIAIMCFCNSCKKTKQEPCIAGTGGSVEVVIFANHGNTPMFNYLAHPDTAFVKFNTLTSPGTSPSDYDTCYISYYSMHDHIHCVNLKCGNYYFYRTAFDSVNNVSYYAGLGITVDRSATGEIDTTFSVQ